MTEAELNDLEECSQMFDFSGFMPAEDKALLAEVRRLRAAILFVLADAESQHPGGWGPDVTMVGVLKRALDRKAE